MTAPDSPLALTHAHPGAPFTVTFDGRRLPALPGQTVAAVLWSAGIVSWRTTRGDGAPRGVFCGIGVCYDCLVTVDGRPNQRACLLPATPGAAIRTQEGTGHDDDRTGD
ncbi:(2Fe-2S)-binding protein [Streptomyces sp. NPDC048290]|uniref:(2Fe-2S)-binding protein n=1 Tax=Streptomyces sp. NPDC048290 TaxID=3155811 RepID=UPI003414B5D6